MAVEPNSFGKIPDTNGESLCEMTLGLIDIRV